MYIVTGKTGTPHVTGADDAAFNAGVVGSKNYIMSNTDFVATQPGTGKVQLGRAEIVIGGVHGRIEGNEVININATSQGMKRIDLIVARYTANADGTQSIDPVLITGTPASSPVVPEHNTGSIYNGASTVDMPLVQVTVEASTITDVRVVAATIPSLEGMIESVDAAVDKLSKQPVVKVGRSELVTIPANGYADVTIPYGYTFAKKPYVVACLMGESRGAKNCTMAIGTTTSRTTSTFVAHLYNNGSTACAMYVSFVAVTM